MTECSMHGIGQRAAELSVSFQVIQPFNFLAHKKRTNRSFTVLHAHQKLSHAQRNRNRFFFFVHLFVHVPLGALYHPAFSSRSPSNPKRVYSQIPESVLESFPLTENDSPCTHTLQQELITFTFIPFDRRPYPVRIT